MTTYREKLYPLGDKMIRAAVDIIGQCELVVTERGLTDPKLLSLALLSRTLANFKGVATLIKEELTVEARVLTRCLYENMFIAGGLHTEGAAFADKMISDEHAGRKNRARFSFENERIFSALSLDTREALKEAVDSFKAAPKLEYLHPKTASSVSPFKESYIAYSQLSGDAAHPTLTALRRHLGMDANKVAYFDVLPPTKDEELDETLHLAFVALIGVMVVVNEMNGFTKAGEQLPALNGELKALQAEKYGVDSVGDGMEIRTGPATS
jgi:hypothetical protein